MKNNWINWGASGNVQGEEKLNEHVDEKPE